MRIKVTVLTPKNQAHKCIKTQREALLGFKKAQQVKEEKVVAHNKFYWIIEAKDEQELNNITAKAARGEVLIRKFYSTLFKMLRRANKLMGKFTKGAGYAKRWLIKMYKKKFSGDEQMISQIESMDDEAFKEYLKVSDQEDMDKLLSKDSLIIVRKV